MPSYNLEVINVYEETEFEFSSRSYDLNNDNIFVNAKRKKVRIVLLNCCSFLLCAMKNS